MLGLLDVQHDLLSLRGLPLRKIYHIRIARILQELQE